MSKKCVHPLTEKMNIKIEAFKEVVVQLLQWWMEGNPEKKIEDNDFNILKVMKLLFFVSGADVENNLFDIFDFQAWTYGHVEADVYNYYFDMKGDFGEFVIDRNKVTFK